MKKSISILGCGWIGLALGKSLADDGYHVKGSTTTSNKLNIIAHNGIQPYLIDINTLKRNVSDFFNADTLIISLTAKVLESFTELIELISVSTIKEVIFISSTSVYPLNNNIVTEQTPVKDTPLANIEQLFLANQTFNTTILRFGGLYGYDREPGHFFKTNKPIKQPEGFINFIHRDDCINILKQLIEKGVTQNVFNACSDTHPSRREFYTHAFKKVGRQTPIFDEDTKLEYKIINSEKLKRFLNYTFKH